MTKKNHLLSNLRLTAETDAKLSEFAEKLDMTKPSLCRFLLNRSLTQLRVDADEVGGIEKLEFQFRPAWL